MSARVEAKHAVVLPLLAVAALWAQQASDSPSFQLQINVDRLLVPVVVRDRQGNTVNDMRKEEFRVLDDGKPRDISGFTVEQRGRAVSAEANGPDAGAANPSRPVPARLTVFLFDDMHLSAEDLAQARNAGMKVMEGALADGGMAAVVSLSGAVNSGITRDRAALQTALAQLKPHSIYHADATDCPNIDYYEADLIENKHDPVAVQDAVRKYINCHPAIANPSEASGGVGGADSSHAEGLVEASVQRALSLGRQDVQSAFARIDVLIKAIANFPGQRSLVLVSSGFLTIERESMDWESRIIDLAARSNVTVSALDARGLYTAEMTASQRSPLLGGRSLQDNTDFQRSTMKLSENVMAELADGTGGTFFHNSNDLETGLRDLAEAPQCQYMLELPIGDVKRNGSLHRLEVKVDREGVQVAARRGYFIPKPEKAKK
jgi:VWFA-related protein